MMIVSDVSVEMVEQLQEVLDAKAAEMTAFRKCTTVGHRKSRNEQSYLVKVKEVMQAKQQVQEAHSYTKLKELDGKVVLSGDPPTPMADNSEDALTERYTKVLAGVRALEVAADSLRFYVELYRNAFEEYLVAKKAHKDAEKLLLELIEKHGYMRKQFGSTHVVLEDSSRVTRVGSVLVHPLYEAAYDAGKYEVEKKEWRELVALVTGNTPPKWAVLDTSEF